jgi:hypothetical protein
MEIKKIEANDSSLIRTFINLPTRLYKDDPHWVPPLSFEIASVFNRKKNPFYKHSEAAFFIAFDHLNQPAGRIAIIDNRKYNEFNHERTAFFYLFECVQDKNISTALFQAGFGWALKQGLDKIIGPKGFTVFDGLGTLIKGFEHRPAFGIPYNPPYYPELITSAGFSPENDIVSGYLDKNFKMPEKIIYIDEMVKKRRGLYIKSFKNRKELQAFLPRLKELYNEALNETIGNTPLSDEEVKLLANQMLWFADPSLIKVVMKENLPVGFLFAYPDISAALQRTKGHLLPFGWVNLLLELHNTKWININGAGIIHGYRGLGGTALLFTEMYNSFKEGKYCYADLVQIGVENDQMQRELCDMGIDFYKTHRVYTRSLS